MNWFVVGTMVTVLWGNGAYEEGRTTITDVFLGTPSACQVIADHLRDHQQQSFERDAEYLGRSSVKHAQWPERYNGGIREAYVAGFCVPFASEKEIKKVFPKAWDMMGGTRLTGQGTSEAFKWWDGANGAALHD